jgi:DNA-directed RNA polymerase specialized sigma subunit
MRGMNKVYYLKLEIKDLQEEIKAIPVVSAMNYSGMPHSTGVSDPTYNLALKREKLVERLHKKINKLVEEIERIENIIEQIDDIEIRTIARMRFIKNMKWEDIGAEMHIDRTACYRKLKKYCEENLHT